MQLYYFPDLSSISADFSCIAPSDDVVPSISQAQSYISASSDDII